MVELSRNDLAAVIEFGARVSAISDPQTFGASILAPLRDLVPADSITYNEIDSRGRTIWAVDPPDALDDTDPAAFARFVSQHPVVSYSRRTGDGQARTISDFMASREFHRTDLYGTFFRPARVEHQIAVTLSYRPPSIVGVALNRVARDFGPRDRAVLNLVRAQLVGFYQAAQDAKEAAELLAAADQALDDLRRGVVLARADGRLIAATQTAQRLLRPHLGGPLQAGQRLPNPMATLVPASPGRSRPFTITGDNGRLYLRVLPSARSDQRIIVVDERPAGDLAPPAASELTGREIQVLDLLATGRSSHEIATYLRVSVRTIHKHLEHVYPKLGVHDRTAAATTWLARRSPTAGSAAEGD